METIFIPVVCEACKRHSVVSFARIELKRRLASSDSIELRCAYDDHSWEASSQELVRILKLVRENDAVDRITSKRTVNHGRDAIANR
jgi:hypothetical protein